MQLTSAKRGNWFLAFLYGFVLLVGGCGSSLSRKSQAALQQDLSDLFHEKELRSGFGSVEISISGHTKVFHGSALRALQKLLIPSMAQGKKLARVAGSPRLGVGTIEVRSLEGSLRFSVSESQRQKGLYCVRLNEIGGSGASLIFFFYPRFCEEVLF